MKLLRLLGVVGLTSISAFAQRHGFTGLGQVTGFGNVVFPGTGHPPNIPANPFSITDTSFASRLGATVSGIPSFHGSRNRFRSGQIIYVPYAYPVYVGGFENPYFSQQPNITVVYPPPGPQVIINQGYSPETSRPVVREYPEQSEGNVHIYESPPRAAEQSAQAGEPEYYLIAFKDHSIYSALAYWVQGDTLHYVTAQGVHNQASLDTVDRELTEKLNSDRNVAVRLPAPKK